MPPEKVPLQSDATDGMEDELKLVREGSAVLAMAVPLFPEVSRMDVEIERDSEQDSGLKTMAVPSFPGVSRMDVEIERDSEQHSRVKRMAVPSLVVPSFPGVSPMDVEIERDSEQNSCLQMMAVPSFSSVSPPNVKIESEKGTILRVPATLRNLHREAYTPSVVSIGPYHYSARRFPDTKEHKRRFLDRFLKRTGYKVGCQCVSELGDQARQSYSSSFVAGNMKTAHGFVQMMLEDACFIIELFRVSSGCDKGSGNSKTDPIFSSRGLVPYIQRDLLLLENQLPFFVLDKLFSATPDKKETATLVKLALQFFKSVVPVDIKANIEGPLHLLHLVQQALLPSTPPRSKTTIDDPVDNNANIKGPLHLLHLVQQALLPSTPPPSKPTIDQPQRSVFPVTVLRECGVKFRKEKIDKLLDIDFDKRKGVLKIPPFMIHDSTKLIFLNLMAFEQCNPRFGDHVTSYLFFMDRLINSSQDVSHLCRKEIIDSYLGNEDDVADLFNSLCREIAFDFDATYLKEVARNVNDYAQKKRHGWMATLRHEYFRNPWAIIAFLVATVILLFTATQTFFTVFPDFVPSSH